MRHVLFLAALLLCQYPQMTIAQQTQDAVTEIAPANADRGALMCPWSIFVLIRYFQRHCHSEEEEFGQKLDQSLRQLESFFVSNKWIDQESIDRAYRFDLGKQIQDHPLSTTEGVVDNICNYKELERTYQRARATWVDTQRELSEKLANPPLLETPGGTPCL
jgi:hypothetical protein